MATTGFWPVKDRLKEVIDYAENPDKTIDKKYGTASVNGQSGLEPILARLLTRFLPPKGLSNNPTEAVRGFSSWQISILTSGWKQRAERRFPTQLAQATRALKTSWHPGRITSIRSLRLPMLHQLRTNTPLLAALTTTGGKDHD